MFVEHTVPGHWKLFVSRRNNDNRDIVLWLLSQAKENCFLGVITELTNATRQQALCSVVGIIVASAQLAVLVFE